ncbi:succinylglutamate desuccinylase [Photobacterium makurazakiensis]|uniref:succinylglutamate desuccinylase n=1 Tax=Photobacterium makurazakiensis TaxID=2910234 RepID=UPI003D1100D3
MSMLQQVKAGNFLEATLNSEMVFESGQWITASGVQCELLARGVLQITPTQPLEHEKSIVLSSGVHGNETSPIELVQRLARCILQSDVTPRHRLLLIIAHPKAIINKTRFIDENMNRLFQTRNEERNIDCITANHLQDAVDHFYLSSPTNRRWHLDLHCAIRGSAHYTFAVSPYTVNPTRNIDLFTYLQVANIEAALLSNTPSSTFSWFSAEFYSAQALTLELGRVADFGENDLEKLESFYQATVKLITQPSVIDKWDDGTVSIYKVTRTLIKHSEAFRFNFPDNQANFSFFEHGKQLASDDKTEYFALEGGESVVFPNVNVAIGQRACLLVQETKVNVVDQVTIIPN